MPPPNIIYLHSHDTGRYIQPYGYGIATPHLQALAEDGVLFRRAFSCAPNCSPSRAALLTGSFPHANGMNGLDHRGGFVLSDYSQHILHTLRRQDYLSVLGGMQHIGMDTDAIGFDRVLGPARAPSALESVPRVQTFLREPARQPFFLDIGFYETHKLGQFPELSTHFLRDFETVDGRYVQPAGPLPDTPEIRKEMAEFAASARVMDDGVGALIATLKEQHLYENTIIICTTDHGLPMPGMKCSLSDEGTGVMLIVRGPGEWGGGRVSDALVSQVDLFPTICDYLHIPAPAWLQGVSLLPLLREQASAVREEVHSEFTYHGSYHPLRAVRTERWKYIRWFGEGDPQIYGEGGAGRDCWIEHGWPERLLAHEQLYDLYTDPHEAHNLIDAPAMANIADDMRARLLNWQQRSGDPILDGPIPAPSANGLLGEFTVMENSANE